MELGQLVLPQEAAGHDQGEEQEEDEPQLGQLHLHLLGLGQILKLNSSYRGGWGGLGMRHAHTSIQLCTYRL